VLGLGLVAVVAAGVTAAVFTDLDDDLLARVQSSGSVTSSEHASPSDTATKTNEKTDSELEPAKSDPANEAKPPPEEEGAKADAPPNEAAAPAEGQPDAAEPGEPASPDPAVPGNAEDEKSPLRAASDALAAGRWQEAYDLADAAKTEERNVRTRIMAEAACQLHKGAKSRDLFRSLIGKETRARVRETCTKAGIDLDYEGKGASPSELVIEATEARKAGDPTKACKLANESNHKQVNSGALAQLALCACDAKKADRARKLLSMIASTLHPPIVAACKAQGVELEP
jgi:hypothetical protein